MGDKKLIQIFGLLKKRYSVIVIQQNTLNVISLITILNKDNEIGIDVVEVYTAAVNSSTSMKLASFQNGNGTSLV